MAAEIRLFPCLSDNFGYLIHDPASKAITKLTEETEWDIRSASAQGGSIVYEAGGRLKSIDANGGAATPLTMTLNADLPERQPHWEDVDKSMEVAHISPSGARVAVTAAGSTDTELMPARTIWSTKLGRFDGA